MVGNSRGNFFFFKKNQITEGYKTFHAYNTLTLATYTKSHTCKSYTINCFEGNIIY